MKDLFWKLTSLISTITLIIVVTSMATAGPADDKKKSAKDKEDPKHEYADQETRAGLLIERTRSRFQMFRGGMPGTDNEKLILYDSWDVANSKEVWMMKDPHTERPSWMKIPFKK